MPTHHMLRGDQCRIVLLGNDGVGKSSLVSQYVDGYFPPTHSPTLLDCMVDDKFIDGRRYRLEIIDCTADADFARQRSPYIETADVILLVYSATDKRSLMDLKKHIEEVVTVRSGGVLTSPRCAAEGTPVAAAGVSGDDSNHHGSVEEGLPYQKEVPIFVVGTHADVASSAGAGAPADKDVSVVSQSMAEKVTEHCMRRAGLLPDSPESSSSSNCLETKTGGKKSDVKKNDEKKSVEKKHVDKKTNDKKTGDRKKRDEEKRGKPAAAAKPTGRMQRLWRSLVQKMSGETEHVKDTARPHPPHHHHNSNGNSTQTARPHGGGPLSTPPCTPLQASAVADVPSGASPRVPLFQLSAANGEAVTQLFEAVLRLHVAMKEPRILSRATSFAVLNVESAGGSSGSSRAPSLSGFALKGAKDARDCSCASSARGGVGDRAPSPTLVTIGSLYGSMMGASHRSSQCNERAVSFFSSIRDADDARAAAGKRSDDCDEGCCGSSICLARAAQQTAIFDSGAERPLLQRVASTTTTTTTAAGAECLEFTDSRKSFATGTTDNGPTPGGSSGEEGFRSSPLGDSSAAAWRGSSPPASQIHPAPAVVARGRMDRSGAGEEATVEEASGEEKEAAATSPLLPHAEDGEEGGLDDTCHSPPTCPSTQVRPRRHQQQQQHSHSTRKSEKRGMPRARTAACLDLDRGSSLCSTDVVAAPPSSGCITGAAAPEPASVLDGGSRHRRSYTHGADAHAPLSSQPHPHHPRMQTTMSSSSGVVSEPPSLDLREHNARLGTTRHPGKTAAASCVRSDCTVM